MTASTRQSQWASGKERCDQNPSDLVLGAARGKGCLRKGLYASAYAATQVHRLLRALLFRNLSMETGREVS